MKLILGGLLCHETALGGLFFHDLDLLACDEQDFPEFSISERGNAKKNINQKFQSMAFYHLPKTWSFLKIARLISLLFTTLSPSPSEGTTLQAKLRGRKIHQQLLVCLLLREGTGSFADFEKWNHHWIVLLLWEVLLHHNLFFLKKRRLYHSYEIISYWWPSPNMKQHLLSLAIFLVLKLKLLQGATLLYLPHRRTGSQDRFRTVDGLRRGKEASGAAQSLGGMR